MRIIAAIVGQSNEVGSGVASDFTPAYGCPMRDPVGPNGSTARSMWPYLSEMLGRKGIWFTVKNTAVGSTSAAHSWCGYIRTWSSGVLVAVGSYVLSGGKTWKCTGASTTVNASTVTPAAGLQADGVTWSELGASLGTDTVGLLSESNPRFDPNGYISTAFNSITGAVGYDEKWCFISIGQGDKTMGTVRADYAAALINITNYMLSRGVKVAIGFTCAGNTAGLDAWYQSELIPGWSDAVVNFNGNSSVIRGANLRIALGPLVTSPATGPGVQSDNLHMNDAAYKLASEAWRDALLAGGW